jgi:ABC-type nitrate/sulfonate/bicarbonate transport system permease component
MASVAGSAPRSAVHGRRVSVPDRLLPWLGVLAVLAVFELLSRSGAINSHFFPPVSQMFRALWKQLGESSFWTAVGNTMEGWALGLGIAAVLAIPIGIVVGSSALSYRSVRGVIEFLRPIPSVALIPLAVLVYGTGLQSKVFLAVYASFWPILVQAIYGVQDVDPVAMDTARSFGFSRLERLRRVTLPSALSYVATGLRISAAVSLILVVTAELVIGAPGLGREINVARQGGATDVMYGLIIATGLLGWFINAVFVRLERRVLHWHPAYRKATT